MKINKILVVTTILSSTAFGQTIQNAIRNTDNEQFTASDQEFRQLIAKEPTNGSNYFYLGENFNAQNEVDSAHVYWKKAAEKDPTAAMSFVALGKSMWVSGNQTGATEQFTKALGMTKNKNAEVLRGISKTYINSDKKNLDEAIRLLEIAIKLEPKNEDNHLLMGDALLAKTNENANNAIKSYNKVLEINPKSVRGIVRIGKLYQRAGSREEANKKYNEAIQIDPGYAPSYRENAELLLNLNMPKKATENWRKYLELNNSLEARYRFVTALFSGKQYCEAITEIESLQKDGFNNYFMERMLTFSYYECESTDVKATAEKGLATSDAFFKLAPSDKVIYLDYKYKGLLLVNAGKDSLAIKEFETASTMNEEAKKELAGQIGKMYMKMKNYPKTIENYEYKLSVDKLTPTENFELGRAYFFGPKNYALADSSFARLAVQSPTYAPASYWRARTALQSDPNNEKWLALDHYLKVIELIKVEDRLQGSNKAMTMEAAKYLGVYFTNSPAKDIAKAKEYFTIVKEIDPNDAQAKDFFTKHK